jgi:hypothetical protein
MVKFTLNKSKDPAIYWNGAKPLPNEINVMSYHPIMSEFELLSIISTLHGYLTAFDIITGADTDTEKDKDINSVLTAFQMYIYPKMPISNYSSSDKRLKKQDESIKAVAIDNSSIQ